MKRFIFIPKFKEVFTIEENTNVTGGAVSGADNETDNSNTQGQATGK